MYKLLIADDEPKIRNGIKGIINWEQMGIEICAEADDGETALCKAKETRPDILLLDICMPFLNGLSLIEKLNEFLQDSIIIIISGHDEFDYAQKAIKLRVFDYLLKPIKKDNLVSVLVKALENLDIMMQKKSYIEIAKKQLESHMPFLIETFLNQIIDGYLSDTEIIENEKFFNIHIPDTSTMLMIKNCEDDMLPGGDSEELSHRIKNLTIQNISKDVIGCRELLLIFNDSKENLLFITDKVIEQNITEEIEKAIKQILHNKIVISSAKVENGLLGIAKTYEILLDDIQKKCGFSFIVSKIISLIEENFADPNFSINNIGEQLFISTVYVSRLLKKATGYTFVEYLTRLRIEKALRLLNNPNNRIVDIASTVGYCTQHYFCTAFKKILGVSPSQYKKSEELV